LNYASKELKSDKGVVLYALGKSFLAFKYVSDILKNNKIFVLKMITKASEILYVVLDNLRDDEEICLEAIKNGRGALEYVSDILRDNEEIVLKAVTYKMDVLQYATIRLNSVKKNCFLAVKNYIYTFDYLSNYLQRDKEILYYICKYIGYFYMISTKIVEIYGSINNLIISTYPFANPSNKHYNGHYKMDFDLRLLYNNQN
jgi:hypothetical protein